MVRREKVVMGLKNNNSAKLETILWLTKQAPASYEASFLMSIIAWNRHLHGFITKFFALKL